MNFITEYYPDINTLTPTQLADARTFVVSVLQPKFSDIDLSPGTPTGDAVVSVLAGFLAASGEAHDRLMSDLVLENVANNIIFSCAFVTKFLGNYGVYDVANLRAAGLVRLTFSADDDYLLGRTMLFRFGGSDDYRLLVSNLDSAGVSIKSAGTPYDGSADTYVLAQTSATTWAVDIPLEGVLTEPVARGATGTATIIPDALVGIAAAIDFLPGLPPASLPDLARMARKIAHSLTSGSRAGIRSMVYRHWPESTMVAPVITGDAEMLRSAPNTAVVLQQPAVDVYYRSVRDLQIETQTVKLKYLTVTSGGHSGLKLFRGKVAFLHRPSKILSATWAGTSSYRTVAGFTLFTRSTDPELYGGQHCGTRYEEFWMEVTPDLDGDTPRLTLVDETDGQYAYFTITYVTDPLIDTVSSTLEAGDNAPPGVSVLVKSGPLVDLDTMAVTYYRRPGTRVLLTPAAAKIASYIATAGYPEVFRQTAIHDIMRSAGAERVAGIACTGCIRLSPADQRIMAAVDDMTSDWFLWSVPVTTLAVAGVTDIVPVPGLIVRNVLTYHTDFADVETWAATGRTLRYRIDPTNITFVEL